jgi:hypothetical protein
MVLSTSENFFNQMSRTHKKKEISWNDFVDSCARFIGCGRLTSEGDGTRGEQKEQDVRSVSHQHSSDSARNSTARTSEVFTESSCLSSLP